MVFITVMLHNVWWKAIIVFRGADRNPYFSISKQKDSVFETCNMRNEWGRKKKTEL